MAILPFDGSACHADLDRWLNPAWKESFLDRMLPFLSARPPAVAPENLRAAGRIAVGEFVLPPLHISHLQGNLELDGRRIALSNASGQFYDGRLSGSVDAILAAVPVYRTSFDFSDVSLSSLASASPNLTKLLSGSASGRNLVGGAWCKPCWPDWFAYLPRPSTLGQCRIAKIRYFDAFGGFGRK